MAISETTLKDTVLMIDTQNKNGGLLGKKLEAVVVDPGVQLAALREKAAQLLERTKSRWCSDADLRFQKISTTGFQKMRACSSTPSSTKGRVVKNVIYTGAAPNQQAIQRWIT